MERNENEDIRTKGLGGDERQNKKTENRNHKAEDTKTQGHHFIYEDSSSITQTYSKSGRAPIFNFRFTISDVCRFYIQYVAHPFLNRRPAVRELLTNFYKPGWLKMKLFRCEWSTASGRLRNPEPN